MMPTNATFLSHRCHRAARPGAGALATPLVSVAFPAGERRRPDLWRYRQELAASRHLWTHGLRRRGRNDPFYADPSARLSALSGRLLPYLRRGSLWRGAI